MTTAPLYALAFPDMKDMPVIPATWSDISWGNDACPRFLAAGYPWGGSLDCWIDYPTLDERETGVPYRYGLLWSDDNGGEERTVYTGDDWNEVLRLATLERLAWRLAHSLAVDMTPADWQAMRTRNAECEPGVCASHDYRDTNMDMHAAFVAEFDRDPLTDIGMSDADVAIWNEAWNIAKTHHLTATSEGPIYSEGAAFDAWRLTGSDYDADGGAETLIYAPGEIETCDGKFYCNVSNLSEEFAARYDAERFLWAMYARREWEFTARTTIAATVAASAPAPASDDIADVLAIITDGADLLDVVDSTTTDNGRAFLYLADGRTVRVTAEIV